MASFVESATLLLKDQSSAKIKKINAELKTLFATAKKISNLPIKLTGLSKATTEVNKLKAATETLSRRPVNMRVQLTGAQQVQSQINALARNRTSTVRQGILGGGPGGGVGILTTSFASSVARFAVAVGIFQSGVAIARSAGRGIITADDAMAMARASGVDADRLAASAARAAGKTRGVPTGMITEAAIEQAGQLETQLTRGIIDLPEFLRRLDATTLRIAENAQIFSVAMHDPERGAEQARQQEKILTLLGTTLKPTEAAAFNDALRRAIVATGFDVPAADIKRKLQQLGSTFAQALDPQGLANVVLLLDEGGAQAIKEIRTASQEFIRGSLNKTDMKRQIEFGLRDKKGQPLLKQEDFKDPIQLAVEEIMPRLRAAKPDIDLGDPIAIASAMDNLLGFTTEASRLWARVIPNLSQFENEIARIGAAKPETLLTQPPLSTDLADVQAKFQDAVVQLSKGSLPLVKQGVQELSDVFKDISQGQAGVADYAKLGLAAMPLGLASAFQAFADPATRPLATAALALDGSAAALTTAAAALTGAAVIQGGAGSAAAFLGSLKKAGPWGLAAAAAIEAGILADKVLGVETGPHDRTFTPPTMEGQNAELREQFRRLFQEFGPRGLDPRDRGVGGMARIIAEREAGLDKLANVAIDAAQALTKVETSATGAVANIPEDPSIAAQRAVRNRQSRANLQDVLDFQKAHGIKQTGKFDAATQAMIREQTNRLVSQGMTVEQIKAKQQELGIKVDGLWGPQSEKAIRDLILAVTTAKKDEEVIATQQSKTAELLQLIHDKREGQIIRASQAKAPVSTFVSDFGKRPDALVSGVITLSPVVQAAIDGIETGGVKAATSITEGFAEGSKGAGSAIGAGMVAAAPQVASIIAAALKNAAANINVQVNAAATGGADTGHVGGSVGGGLPTFGGPR